MKDDIFDFDNNYREFKSDTENKNQNECEMKEFGRFEENEGGLIVKQSLTSGPAFKDNAECVSATNSCREKSMGTNSTKTKSSSVSSEDRDSQSSVQNSERDFKQCDLSGVCNRPNSSELAEEKRLSCTENP